MQMTAFMEMFGSHVTPTMNPPFDPRIELISQNSGGVSRPDER